MGVNAGMPPHLKLKQVNSLTEILVKFVASFLHNAAKVCVKMKRARSDMSEAKLNSCRNYFTEVSNCIPANLYEEFMAFLQSLILSEKSLLDEIYYDAIGSLLNKFTKKLILDKASMFQDSSMAIEAFLQHLEKAKNTKQLTMVKNVVDLIDYEFEPTLLQIATFSDLHTLKLPGLKQIDIETDTMAEFLQLLQNNCMHLHTLELNESTIDNECCNILGEISSISVLNLNHCTKLESSGVLHLLKKLGKLTRIDALRGKSSNVQNALDIFANENKTESNNSCDNSEKRVTKLTHMTFRDPHGIPKVAPLCPAVRDVKIIYNVFEFNYDASVDNCLVHLELFPNYRSGGLELSADLNCLNMLFVIQWRNIKLWGPSLKKVTLTEPEFLHPQTLNPFALQCKNLAEMIIVNPSTISDDLFVGRVPELAKEPFKNLKKLTFEGEKFPKHVSNFLIGKAVNIEELNIILDGLNQGQFQDYLLMFQDQN